MQVTIDPYYPIQFYNECKEALKNNAVKFKEMISTKQPFNWYFDVEQSPIMVNYDKVADGEKRWLVTKVKALLPQDEYLLMRRNNDKGKQNLQKYINNTPLQEAHNSDFAVFFTVKNKEELVLLTQEMPVKIWYFGKYYNNKFRVCLCNNKYIMNLLSQDQILLQKTKEHKEIGRFESELNFKVFRGNDFLEKFTQQPYFENGTFIKPKVQGDERSNNSRFTI